MRKDVGPMLIMQSLIQAQSKIAKQVEPEKRKCGSVMVLCGSVVKA